MMLVEDRVLETAFSFSNDVPAPPERRAGERFLKILRVGTLVIDGRRELCLIRNISAGGLMAHVYSKLEVGQHVAVELKSSLTLSGRVVWVRETNAGIAFDDKMDVGELLANPAVLDNGWRARTPRVEIDRMATLRDGARTHWVRACDISQSGVRVETDKPPSQGAAVVLTLEGLGPLHGLVRWAKEDSCGIAFNEVMPFTQLIDWLKRS
jgi:hypothetical protein